MDRISKYNSRIY